jgi:pyridoxine 4-dehydrogenase
MASIDQSGTFTLGDRTVKRLGYGAMQFAGPGVFGPPKDHDAALAVLREAVASGSITSTPATSTARTSPTG